MPSPGSLFFSLIVSALGMAYIVYGRRRAKLVPVVAGVILCLYTYFIDDWLWLCVVGAMLAVVPFVVDG